MRFLVLGAGLQGSACAFDLLATTDAVVTLADRQTSALPHFLAPYAGDRLRVLSLDVRDHTAVRAAMREHDSVLSAIPYYFNFPLAQLAVECGAHFADLGGNTEIVLQQRGLDADAEAQGVSIVPDTGLAPGMVNVIAQHGIAQFDTVQSVRMYVGGLPLHPEPPLNYQVVYSLEGVVDYYTTESLVVRHGRRTRVAALSEVEPVAFPAPIGTLEAFHTAGGLSTMALRYEGVIPEMEYKTLRYPGHAATFASIRALGLLSLDPVDVRGTTVVPRDVFVKVAGDALRKPDSPDMVVLRVVVTGTRDGSVATRAWQLVDRYDATHGITAMMRTTGYTLSLTGQMQVRGELGRGVRTPDECVPAERYFSALRERGVDVREVSGDVSGDLSSAGASGAASTAGGA